MPKRHKGKDATKITRDDDMEDDGDSAPALTFEDPFDDEYEEEEEIEEVEGEGGDEMQDEEEEEAEVQEEIWWPDQAAPTGEEMEYEMSAYDMLHQLHVEWPCLSFTFLKDDLGASRTKYPMTMYMVSGTQADRKENNKLVLMKIGHLCRTKHDNDEDSDLESEGEDDFDDDPTLEYRAIPHNGAVNRIKSMPQKSNIVATWSETGKVSIWDLSEQIKALDHPPTRPLPPAKHVPIKVFDGHEIEGYALDWSSVVEGRLASGDCNGRIRLWTLTEGGWQVEKASFKAKGSGSVEDLKWSPVENDVFASCSVDGAIRIWDSRDRKRKPQITKKNAHMSDINVIDWHPLPGMSHILVSGGDDGAIKTWDLRYFTSGDGDKHASSDPTGHLSWHQGPITSVEWDIHDSGGSSLGAASEDGRVSYWDLALEAEKEPDKGKGKGTSSSTDAVDAQGDKIPPQLLFVHMGVSDPKEVHHHPQLPGVSAITSADGIHVVKPWNLYAKS